jgi:hypothetical protein
VFDATDDDEDDEATDKKKQIKPRKKMCYLNKDQLKIICKKKTKV